jgi:hypothetical protein
MLTNPAEKGCFGVRVVRGLIVARGVKWVGLDGH